MKRLAILFSWFICGVLFISCSDTSGDLSRSKAKYILDNKYPLKAEYEFSVVNKDIVSRLENGGYLQMQIRKKADMSVYYLNLSNKITPFLIKKRTYSEDSGSEVTVNIGDEIVNEITGITKVDSNSNMVEYTTIIMPNEIGKIVLSEKGGETKKWKAILRKYDDGWRLEDRLRLPS